MNTLKLDTSPRAGRMWRRLRQGWSALVATLAWMQAPALLGARLYVAHVFFLSGLESLRSWDATL